MFRIGRRMSAAAAPRGGGILSKLQSQIDGKEDELRRIEVTVAKLAFFHLAIQGYIAMVAIIAKSKSKFFWLTWLPMVHGVCAALMNLCFFLMKFMDYKNCLEDVKTITLLRNSYSTTPAREGGQEWRLTVMRMSMVLLFCFPIIVGTIIYRVASDCSPLIVPDFSPVFALLPLLGVVFQFF